MTAYKLLPSEPTYEMLAAFFEVAGEYCIPAFTSDKVLEAFAAYWQAAPVVEQNPVAIVRRYRDGTKAAEIYDRSMEEGTKLYTHQQPKREPDGYFYTSHDWAGTRRDHSREYPVSDAHTTYSDIEPYWLTPRDRSYGCKL